MVCPASGSEHRRTPGSYESLDSQRWGGSEKMLAVPGTSSSPPSSSGAVHPGARSRPHAGSLVPLSSPPTAQEQTWVAATEEQGCGEQRNDTSKTQSALGSGRRGDSSSTGGTPPMCTDADVLLSRENEIKAAYGSVLIRPEQECKHAAPARPPCPPAPLPAVPAGPV